MRRIPLTQGRFALVDDADYPQLSKFNWCLSSSTQPAYALRGIGAGGRKKKMIYMHRVVAEAPTGMEVDHINGDTLDNRRSNVRVCSHAENCRNRKMSKANTSGLPGVSFHRATGKWQAQIKVNYRSISLGIFKTPNDAHTAFKRAAQKHFGKYARA